MAGRFGILVLLSLFSLAATTLLWAGEEENSNMNPAVYFYDAAGAKNEIPLDDQLFSFLWENKIQPTIFLDSKQAKQLAGYYYKAYTIKHKLELYEEAKPFLKKARFLDPALVPLVKPEPPPVNISLENPAKPTVIAPAPTPKPVVKTKPSLPPPAPTKPEDDLKAVEKRAREAFRFGRYRKAIGIYTLLLEVFNAEKRFRPDLELEFAISNYHLKTRKDVEKALRLLDILLNNPEFAKILPADYRKLKGEALTARANAYNYMYLHHQKDRSLLSKLREDLVEAAKLGNEKAIQNCQVLGFSF